MQKKINEQFISEYTRTFSSQVASTFFKEKNVITGKEILSLTPSKQVNFFVLKTLYGQWQEEMKKLESPYFNYREPEVKKALVNYMNVLSQYIEVEEQEIKALLEVAISETLYWLISPVQTLQQELNQKKIGSTDQESLKGILRYFKIYSNEIKEALETNEGVEVSSFISAFESRIESNDPENVINDELQRLSEIEQIEISDVLITDKVQTEELVFEEPDEESIDQEEAPVDEEEIDEIEAESNNLDSGEQKHEEDEPEVVQEEAETEDSGASDVELEDDLTGSEEESDYVDGSLNEQFKKEEETLNDQFKQEEVSVVTKHQQKKVETILEAISVNSQYMFTSKLFGGDSDVFLESIGKIEKSKSFDDAVEMLVRDYAPTYSWDMNSNEVKELLKIVFRKFR